MEARWPALLVAALAVAPAAQAAQAQAEFGTPALLEGRASVGGLQWALLVFGPGPVSFEASLDGGGQATNHTLAHATAAGVGVSDQAVPPQPPASLPGPVAGRLDGRAGAWGSLYVEADRILLAADARALLGVAGQGDVPEDHLPGVHVPADTSRSAFRVQAGAALALAANGTQATFPFRLTAAGVHRLEWHNATFACVSQGPCPAGSASRRVEAPLGAGDLMLNGFTEVQVPGGTLAGAGEAVAVAAGGPRLDAVLAGRLRLPDAHLAGRCGAAPCPDPDGRTFLANGNVTLAGLEREPSGSRLHATLTGGFAAAYDESPVAAFAALPLAAGAGLGLLGFLGLLFGRHLWALFARSQRPPPLEHPRRQELLDRVRSDPGLSFRGLQRSLGWPTGPLQAHLARLLDARLVVAQPHRNTVRYFENHGRYEATWKAVTLLRDPGSRRLHAWVRAHPGSTQQEAVQAVRGWGWSRAKALRRLAGLEEASLVERQRRGRTVHYVALEVAHATGLPAASAPPNRAVAASAAG